MNKVEFYHALIEEYKAISQEVGELEKILKNKQHRLEALARAVKLYSEDFEDSSNELSFNALVTKAVEAIYRDSRHAARAADIHEYLRGEGHTDERVNTDRISIALYQLSSREKTAPIKKVGTGQYVPIDAQIYVTED